DGVYEGDETQNFGLQNPSNANIDAANDDHVVTIKDDENLPTVQFASSTGDTDENVASGSIEVTLSHEAEANVTVLYTVAEVTALDPEDYELATDTLTFTPGQVSKFLIPTINDDPNYEGDET